MHYRTHVDKVLQADWKSDEEPRVLVRIYWADGSRSQVGRRGDLRSEIGLCAAWKGAGRVIQALQVLVSKEDVPVHKTRFPRPNALSPSLQNHRFSGSDKFPFQPL